MIVIGVILVPVLLICSLLTFGFAKGIWQGITSTDETPVVKVKEAVEEAAPISKIETTSTPTPDYTPAPDDQVLAAAATATAETVRENLDGQLVFTRNTKGGQEGAYEIYSYDLHTGETTRLTDNDVNDWIPRWLPRGTWITFTSNRSGQYDIWAMKPDGSNPQPVISSGGWDEYASRAPREMADWSDYLAFITTAETAGVQNPELYISSASGTTRLTENQVRDEWPSWWPYGTALVFSHEHENGDMDIASMPLLGDAAEFIYEPDIIYGTGADENQPAASPTGAEIAFIERSDTRDAYGHLMLLTFSDEEDEHVVQLIGESARSPSWSPDGEWIVFSHGVDTNRDDALTHEDQSDLWAIRPSDGVLGPLLQDSSIDDHPSWGYADYGAVPTSTPADDHAQITHISIDDSRYVVDFKTVGFTPELPGQHIHFFFNTVAPEDAGLPGSGPWQIYPTQAGEIGTSPFTLYKVSQRPNQATQMCVLVANPNHSVQQNTGNCFDLP